MATTKSLTIVDSAGQVIGSNDIGAEAQNIEIARDAEGKIIANIYEPGVVIQSRQGVAEALKNIEEAGSGLIFDDVPTAGSENPVKSDGLVPDDGLDLESSRPVENRVITERLNEKISNFEISPSSWDTVPTQNSGKPITSGGVYSALNNVHITVDDTLSTTSANPVQNNVITSALNNKQNTLTFDNVPTENSNNPITSDGVYSALDTLQSNFQAGCNIIVQAVTAKGQTPASNSPSDIATAISNISTGPEDLSLLSKMNYTESEFLNSVCKKDWFDYNAAGAFIYKTVTISNSQQDGAKSMDWIIIDYNHDSTSYTFDLLASRAMFDSIQFGSSQMYEDSGCIAKNTIESAITGFSSELQARLQTMTVSVNSTTVSSKIKLLSLTEMGIANGDSHPGVEGNVYDKYFVTGRSTSTIYTDLIRNNSSGSAVTYWLRSRIVGYSNGLWTVDNDGAVSNGNYFSSFALIPVIRITIA